MAEQFTIDRSCYRHGKLKSIGTWVTSSSFPFDEQLLMRFYDALIGELNRYWERGIEEKLYVKSLGPYKLVARATEHIDDRHGSTRGCHYIHSFVLTEEEFTKMYPSLFDASCFEKYEVYAARDKAALDANAPTLSVDPKYKLKEKDVVYDSKIFKSFFRDKASFSYYVDNIIDSIANSKPVLLNFPTGISDQDIEKLLIHTMRLLPKPILSRIEISTFDGTKAIKERGSQGIYFTHNISDMDARRIRGPGMTPNCSIINIGEKQNDIGIATYSSFLANNIDNINLIDEVNNSIWTVFYNKYKNSDRDPWTRRGDLKAPILTSIIKYIYSKGFKERLQEVCSNNALVNEMMNNIIAANNQGEITYDRLMGILENCSKLDEQMQVLCKQCMPFLVPIICPDLGSNSEDQKVQTDSVKR